MPTKLQNTPRGRSTPSNSGFIRLMLNFKTMHPFLPAHRILWLLSLCLWAVQVAVPGKGLAQNPSFQFHQGRIPPVDSSKGNNLPAFDTLRVLYVFVRFRDGEEPDSGIPDWPVSRKKAPDYARNWLAANPAQMPDFSISNYFREASLGRFIFYGDIYPDIIVLDSAIQWYHTKGGYAATTQEIIRKMNASGKVDWKKYDNWGREAGKWQKKADRMVDHMGIIFRTTPPAIDPKCAWLGSGGGIAGLQGGVEWVRDSLFVHGGGLMSGLIVNGGGTGDPAETMKTLKHETAHFLTLHHYSATNDRTGGPDLGTHGGWGLASASGSSSIAVNSWDRYWLGWAYPNLDIQPDSLPSAVITLGDFVTTGAAVRIALPYTQEEWFWLEYHANRGKFDQVDKGGPALFILHQTGKTGPHHLDVEEADGRYDYSALEQTDTRCCGRHWKLARKNANPLLGYGDRDVSHLDKDGNRKLDRTDLSGVPVFMVDTDGEAEIIHYLGDGGDGFRAEYGRNKFGIATNPSTASNGNRLRDLVSRINGIEIQVLGQTDSTITLSYRSDRFGISQSVRWSGNIEIRDSVILEKGKQLTVCSSETFVRMQDTFPGGHLVLKKGSRLVLKGGSRLWIQDRCSLTLEAGASLILEKDARIMVQKGGRLNYEPGQIILTDKRSRLLDLNK